MKLFTGIVKIFKNGEFSEEGVSAYGENNDAAEDAVIDTFKDDDKIFKGRMKEDSLLSFDSIKRIGRMRSKTSGNAYLVEGKDGFLQAEDNYNEGMAGDIEFLP